MHDRSPDLLKYRLLGAAGILLMALIHSIHDLLDGDPPPWVFLPAIGIATHAAALSLGQKLARKRGWSVLTSIALAVLASEVFGVLTVLLHGRPPSSLWHGMLSTSFAGLGLLAVWGLVLYFPGKLVEARTRAIATEAQLRKAELERLRANLHPHFLLNTLNAISGLLVSEPRQARQLVTALGDLLRDSLEEQDAMRPLGVEVDWLRRYAEIFEIRYRGSIHFDWNMAPNTCDVPVPRLLLQPLLENTIEHGALKHPGGGKVMLSSTSDGSAMRITVADDGPGFASDQRGLGLRLVEDRFHVAYPDGKMRIDSTGQGTQITLELPMARNA